MEDRKCTRCGTNKPLSMFGVKKHRKDGISLWCKECAAESMRKWARANSERKADAAKLWKQNNPEAFKVIVKKSQEKHRNTRLPKQRDLANRHTAALTDNYVKTALGLSGLVPNELIEAKRISLQIHRLLKEMK